MGHNAPPISPIISMKFKTIDSAIIDENTEHESLWYSVYTRDHAIWQWLNSQHIRSWAKTNQQYVIDLRSDLYSILCLKFG